MACESKTSLGIPRSRDTLIFSFNIISCQVIIMIILTDTMNITELVTQLLSLKLLGIMRADGKKTNETILDP